jgi:hypothetical protein
MVYLATPSPLGPEPFLHIFPGNTRLCLSALGDHRVVDVLPYLAVTLQVEKDCGFSPGSVGYKLYASYSHFILLPQRSGSAPGMKVDRD